MAGFAAMQLHTVLGNLRDKSKDSPSGWSSVRLRITVVLHRIARRSPFVVPVPDQAAPPNDAFNRVRKNVVDQNPNPQSDASEAETTDVVLAEDLIEEVSIDGMCGVY